MKKTKTEKFMRMWEKERRKGKDRYIAYRATMMGAAAMLGNAMGRVVFRDEPFVLGFYLFVGGAIGGAIGSSIAWKRDEERYLKLIEEKEPEEGTQGPGETD